MTGCGWLGRKPSFEVREGEPLEIRLPANFSTGYRWVLDPPAQSGRILSDNYVANSSDQRSGAPGIQTFRVEFPREGRFNLKFAYRRLWESSSTPPAQTTNWVILVKSRKADPSMIETMFPSQPPSEVPQPEEDQPQATPRKVELRNPR